MRNAFMDQILGELCGASFEESDNIIWIPATVVNDSAAI